MSKQIAFRSGLETKYYNFFKKLRMTKVFSGSKICHENNINVYCIMVLKDMGYITKEGNLSKWTGKAPTKELATLVLNKTKKIYNDMSTARAARKSSGLPKGTVTPEGITRKRKVTDKDGQVREVRQITEADAIRVLRNSSDYNYNVYRSPKRTEPEQIL